LKKKEMEKKRKIGKLKKKVIFLKNNNLEKKS
jgi:hypothetical protein